MNVYAAMKYSKREVMVWKMFGRLLRNEHRVLRKPR